MNILKSYAAGYKNIYSLKKIITIIFGITVMLGLAIAFPFYSTLSGGFSARPVLKLLFTDFNSTVYFDFMNNYGDMVRPFFALMIWMGIFYFFFTVFFAGGILKLLDGSSIKSKAQAFFAGSSKFFFRFLRLGFYILIFQIITFAVIAVGFSSILNRSLSNSAEPKLFAIIVIWISFHVLAFIFYSLVSDYAKIILVKEDSKKVLRALWNSFIFSVKRIYLVYTMYLLLLVVPLIIVIAYAALEINANINSGLMVAIMFALQQLFIWARIFCKAWILGSEYDLFANYIAAKNRPLITQEMLLDESL